jgi:hypothetical protein
VIGSFDEFRDAHGAEHQTAFNRASVALGNALIIFSTVPLMGRRWRRGAAAFIGGAAITAVGHAAEGNLPRAVRDLARYPIWSVRCDLALARDVIIRRL